MATRKPTSNKRPLRSLPPAARREVIKGRAAIMNSRARIEQERENIDVHRSNIEKIQGGN